jgi:hypothetical protein
VNIVSRMRAWTGYCALIPALLLAFAGCQQASPPDLIVIDTFPAGYNQNDTYLTLTDASGTVLAQDDNGFPDQTTYVGFSRIIVSGGLASGTYYIKVHKPTVAGNPNYAIRVLEYDPGSSFPVVAPADEDETSWPPPPRDDPVDVNGVPTNPWTIAIGDVISRSIYDEDSDPPNAELYDVDWFKLVIP